MTSRQVGVQWSCVWLNLQAVRKIVLSLSQSQVLLKLELLGEALAVEAILV